MFDVKQLSKSIAILALALMFAPLCATASNGHSASRVLIVASYHQSDAWTRKLLDSVTAELKKNGDAPDFEIDDLNSVYEPEFKEQERIWLRYLKQIREKRYAAVVLLDNPAVEVMLAHYWEFPPDVPVIFAGYEYCPADFKQMYPNVTGVVQRSNAEGTLRLAVQLYPNTQEIVVISDSMPESAEFASRLEAKRLSINGITPKFWSADGVRPNDFFRKVSDLPPDTVIMLSRWRWLNGNDYQTLEAFAEDFKNYCHRVFFVNGSTMIGHGALGGYVTNPEIHGREAARLVRLALKDGTARKLPLVQGEMTFLADYMLAEQSGLDFSKFPADTVFVNPPESFWDKHKQFHIILVALIAAVLAFTLHTRRIYRKNRQLFNLLPGRVGVMDRNEKVLFLKTEPMAGFDAARMHELKDIPGIDYQKISDFFQRVFRTGKMQSMEYEFHNVTRSITASPVPRRLFGCHSLIWLSRDMSELQKMRKASADQLRQADIERQMLINTIDIPVWMFDRTGKMIRCNQSVQTLLGMTQEEILARPCHEIFHCGHGLDGACPVKSVIENHQPVQTEISFGGRDYIINARPVFDAGGELIYVAESGRDVTEHNAVIANSRVINDCWETLAWDADMDEAIKKCLALICNHLGASRTYILQFDTAGKTTSCYSEYCKPGRPAIIANIKNRPYGCEQNWENIFASKNLLSIPDVPAALKTNLLGGFWDAVVSENRICSFYCHRLILDGKFWGYCGITYENESRRELSVLEENFFCSAAHFIEIMIRRLYFRRQLEDAVEKSQAATKAKSEFVATISHEIRTPLNAVIGFAELLRSGSATPEEMTEYLEAISSSGNALLQLINDVLDLSKLEADRMAIEPTATDFGELCQEMAQIFAFRLKEKSLELRLEMPPLPILELDQIRVRQVLFNLLGNAVKFTDSGRITIRADFVKTDGETGTFRCSVADTGVGISPENQAKLMEPFVQVTGGEASKRAVLGTGLGLSITKRLAKKMGGALTLESAPGRGSTFTVTLHNVRWHEKRSESPQAKPPARTNVSYEKVSILLVDDVAMNLKVMKAMCVKIGVTDIVAVSSGSDALSQLERRKFDIVMTDMWMPDMNGDELAAKIRADNRFAAAAIVAVTADAGMNANVPSGSFDGVLLKPVTLDGIRKIIDPFTHIHPKTSNAPSGPDEGKTL